MIAKFCRWCWKPTLNPNHFNSFGECVETMRKQNKYAEFEIKDRKENPGNLSQPTYDPGKHKWGG